MALKEVTDKYAVISTKKLANGKSIRTKAGVAQRFEDGKVHVVLNVIPLDGQLWLEPNEASESYADPE